MRVGDRSFAGLMLGVGGLSACAVLLLTVCTGPGKQVQDPTDKSGDGDIVPMKGPDTGSDPFEAHLSSLSTRVPDGFTVIVQEPFVVIGDEHPQVVQKRATGTVKMTVDALKEDFFDRDPVHIIDIWLFKDASSYAKHAKMLFGHEPDTPYGYYSGQEKALVMNIATGGGTLVHEIVHPFMEANFPACPPWFDEGLGSLYEQCQVEDGHLMGMTNWRLAGLKEAIEEGQVPTFQWLTSQTDDQFYGADPGTNYAQSRYLLYYLQEKGLLVDYYHSFVANQEDDPSGFQTLGRTLGEDDMVDFQDRWEKWVLGLTFDG